MIDKKLLTNFENKVIKKIKQLFNKTIKFSILRSKTDCLYKYCTLFINN